MSPKKVATKIKDDAVRSAPKELLEDLFEDYYRHRVRIYKMNFVRGLVFGFGSVIGGTIMIAALLWVLSFFNELPFLGELTESAQRSIQNRGR